jgi:hypothetical protein
MGEAALRQEGADPALAIVDEFIRGSEPDVRRKGARALGALGTRVAAERLVESALTDGDDTVRAAAEAAIACAHAADPRTVEAVLDARLALQPRPTYAMLGRLRAVGLSAALAPVSWATRLRRALTLGDQLRRQPGSRFWTRNLRPTLLGAAFGAVLSFLLLNALQLGGKDEDLGAGSWLGFFACFAAPLVAVWMTPTRLHFDRLAGIAADTLTGAVATVLLGGVLVIALEEQSRLAIVHLLVLPLWIAAVRAVTSMTAGTIPVPYLGFFLTATTAGLAGAIAWGLAAAVFAALLGVSLEDVETWSIFWPPSFALAWVCASIERQPPRPATESGAAMPVAARVAFAATWLATLAMISLGLPFTEPPPRDGDSAELTLAAAAGGKPGAEWLVTQAPVRYTLEVRERGVLAVQLKGEGGDSRAYSVELVRRNEAPAGTKDPWRLQLALQPKQELDRALRSAERGTYLAVVRVGAREERSTALARLAERAARRFGMQREAGLTLKLTVTLLPESVLLER